MGLSEMEVFFPLVSFLLIMDSVQDINLASSVSMRMHLGVLVSVFFFFFVLFGPSCFGIYPGTSLSSGGGVFG